MAEPADYNRNVVDYRLREKLGRQSVSGNGLSGGGGDGTSGDMEARVAQLETDMREVKANTRTISDTLIRIEGKLDLKATSIEVAELKGKLDSKASAADLGMMSGKLNDKPGTWQVFLIVLALGGILAGSQIIKTVVDIINPPSQQAIKTP